MIFISMALPLSARADVKDYEQEEGTSANLFTHNSYRIAFFNTPHLSDNTFTMRVSSVGKVSGCAHTTGNYVEVKTIGNTMKIEVVESQTLLNDKEPLYAHYACQVNGNESFFDVLLDRDKLIAKKIEHIQLKSREYGDFQIVDIKTTKNNLKFTSTSPHQEKHIIFWFHPKNTVTLQAPNAKNRDDVRDAIRAFGMAQGLTPIEKVVKDYHFPHDAHNYVVFSDTDGRLTKGLDSLETRVPVGQITVTETRYGANGPVEVSHNLKIIAKRTKNTFNRRYSKRLY